MVKQFPIHMWRQFVLHLNMLDLGPLHKNVSTHIHAIIANPHILLYEKSSNITAFLEGDEWQHLDVFKCICELNLSYLKELLVSFLTGAEETSWWAHFTSKFAPNGLIDGAQLLRNGTLHGCLLPMMRMRALWDNFASSSVNNLN